MFGYALRVGGEEISSLLYGIYRYLNFMAFDPFSQLKVEKFDIVYQWDIYIEYYYLLICKNLVIITFALHNCLKCF